MRNTIISIFVIAILLVGGGFAYTYFLGPDGTQTADAVQEPVQTQQRQVAPPAKQDPNAQVGASVQALTSPVKPGSNASVTVRTGQLAKCKIGVTYNNVASTDSGLLPKAADEFGSVSWTWTVGASVPEGKHPVKIDCSNAAGSKSASVQADLVVSAKPEASATN